jgi:hypothetical protein
VIPEKKERVQIHFMARDNRLLDISQDFQHRAKPDHTLTRGLHRWFGSGQIQPIDLVL